jgi:hypothetical protein
MLPDTEMAVHRLPHCAVVCMLDAVPWVDKALRELMEKRRTQVPAVSGPVVEVQAGNGDTLLAVPEGEVTQFAN